MSENENEDVGYKKPPKASQWKPGHSGNPKGRPKKTKGFEKLLDHELSRTLRITDCGETLTITKKEGLIKTLITLALKGNLTALKFIVSLMKEHHTIEDFAPDPADLESLMAFVERAKIEDEKPEEPRNG